MTEKTRYTPGPWQPVNTGEFGWTVMMPARTGHPLRGASLQTYTMLDEADARLIAAAPDLYEALEAATNDLSVLMGDGSLPERHKLAIGWTIDKCRAALDKAVQS